MFTHTNGEPFRSGLYQSPRYLPDRKKGSGKHQKSGSAQAGWLSAEKLKARRHQKRDRRLLKETKSERRILKRAECRFPTGAAFYAPEWNDAFGSFASLPFMERSDFH